MLTPSSSHIPLHVLCLLEHAISHPWVQGSSSVDHVLSPFSSASDLIWTCSPLILSHCLSPLSPPRPGGQELSASTVACHGRLLARPALCLMAVCEGMCVQGHVCACVCARDWSPAPCGGCTLCTAHSSRPASRAARWWPTPELLRDLAGGCRDCQVDPLAFTEGRGGQWRNVASSGKSHCQSTSLVCDDPALAWVLNILRLLQ